MTGNWSYSNPWPGDNGIWRWQTEGQDQSWWPDWPAAHGDHAQGQGPAGCHPPRGPPRGGTQDIDFNKGFTKGNFTIFFQTFSEHIGL